MPALNFKIIICLFSIAFFNGCHSKQKPGKGNNFSQTERITVPDSIVRYLIRSAAQDFKDHTPPAAMDFRNVRKGYIDSKEDTVFLICGEFFAQEESGWQTFTTILTSKYEQYIGSNIYCEKAKFNMEDTANLSSDLRTFISIGQ